MTKEMHNAMQKLIDVVRPFDMDAWLEEIDVINAEGDMPWMIDCPTHIATKLDGKTEIIAKKRMH